MTDRGALAPVSLLDASADASFDAEQRDLLFRRCRLIFLIGMAASALMVLVAEGVPELFPATPGRLQGSELPFNIAYPSVFALGLGSLMLGRPGPRRLQLTAFVVVAGAAAVLVTDTALNPPDYPPSLILSLLLFGAAAFLPWKVPYQTVLGVFAVAAFLTSRFAAYALASSVREIWSPIPGGREAFLSTVIVEAAGVAVIAAVAVVVTRTVYDLRRKAHSAQALGGYELREPLGEGGMGAVFLAQHRRMCRPSAVKVLQRAPGRSPLALERFEREIRLSSSLSHPNTIAIYDFGRADRKTFFYAMEYLRGLDLRTLVERFGPLPPERTVAVLLQVCGSLAEAHAKDIVHRDLKPSNIFLTERGGVHDFVKVLDFGLAKEVETGEGADLTGTGVVLGTPHYLAPEAAFGAEHFEKRSDLYSLGAVAYWMLTGQPPFEGSSAVDVMAAHVKKKPDRLADLCEFPLAPELEEAIMRCLAKRPEDRFAGVTDLEAALRGVTFDRPWDEERAREWWELHLPV